ncbi:MAG TPA: hypothetical protein VLJ44_09760 [Gaiellaceae bacterium]|nr:hypothetical protein [Gaiellaceae bacterium]
MPTVLFAAIVVAFLLVGVVLVRRTQRGGFVVRLPVDVDENVLLEEAGLKVAHRFRRMSVWGGWTTTYRVRSTLTDRRILLATGGPAGERKLVILMILDFSAEAPSVSETGYAAYLQKFGLANGYPTYYVSPSDLTADGDELRFVVPFPEGDPPAVRFSTPNAARYVEAISAVRVSSASP